MGKETKVIDDTLALGRGHVLAINKEKEQVLGRYVFPLFLCVFLLL